MVDPNRHGAAKITTSAATTAELLSDRAAIEAGAHSGDTVPVDSLELVSPVGPALVMFDAHELKQFGALRLRLR